MSITPAARPSIQVSIDSGGVTWRHWGYLGFIFLLLLADGMDVTIVAHVFPSLIKEWGVSVGGGITMAVTGGFIFMGVGALIAGRLGDLWGRKVVLTVATVLFGATTALSATASDFTTWTIWRFIASIGIGAVMPTANALLADLTPSTRRSAFLSVGYAGVGLGATVGALLAGTVIPTSGWRALLMTAGIAPVVIVAIFVIFVPESPTFYAARGKLDQANRVLKRLAPAIDPAQIDYSSASRVPENRKEALGVILSKRYRLSTVLLFLFGFFSLGSQLMLNQYLPTLLQAKAIGMSTGQSSAIVSAYGIASVTSALVIGAVLARAPRWWVILASILAAAAVAVIAGTVGVAEFGSLMVALVTVGFFLPAAFGPSRNVLAAPTFPVKLRGTGIGSTELGARLGSASGGAIGGPLIAAGLSLGGILLVMLIPLTAMLVLLLGLWTDARRHGTAGARGYEEKTHELARAEAEVI